MSKRPSAVITGATNGIGQATAIELARRGFDIGIICRNPKKGDETKALIASAAPEANVTILLADYCDLSSVRAVAPQIVETFPMIDVFVNNAGIHNPEQRITADGFDEMLQVNYLAPFLLTDLLLPHLEKQDRCRIVNVGSEAHRLGGSVGDGVLTTIPKAYGTRGALAYYGKTKLLDVLWTLELARRIDGTKLTANTLCPGMVNTGLFDESSFTKNLSNLFVRVGLVRTPERGARMSIWQASDPAAEEINGRFLTSTAPAKLLPTRRVVKDKTRQARLYDDTVKLLEPVASSQRSVS